jgi:hypothetical protein
MARILLAHLAGTGQQAGRVRHRFQGAERRGADRGGDERRAVRRGEAGGSLRGLGGRVAARPGVVADEYAEHGHSVRLNRLSPPNTSELQASGVIARLSTPVFDAMAPTGEAASPVAIQTASASRPVSAAHSAVTVIGPKLISYSPRRAP